MLQSLPKVIGNPGTVILTIYSTTTKYLERIDHAIEYPVYTQTLS